MSARVLGFPVRITDRKPKKAKARKKPAVAGKAAEPQKPRKTASELLKTAETFKSLLSTGMRSVARVVRSLYVERLSVDVAVGTPDAADTALLYGRLHAAIGSCFGLLAQAKRLGELHLRIEPDFDADETKYSVSAALRLRPIRLVGAALRLLFAVIRLLMQKNAPATPTPDTKGGTHTMAHPIETLLNTSMQKIKEMVDVNTIIGDPIKVSETVSIIPVSRVSVGFASGGSDIPSKQEKDLFGGGSGAGIKIDPLAFIVISGDDVKILPYTAPPAAPSDRAVSMVPEMFDKITALFQKKKPDVPADAPANAAESAAVQ